MPSVGASGAIFGLFGLICGFTLRARHLLPPDAFTRLRTGILLSLGLNVALTLAIPMIDVAAHLGGLLVGTAAGLLATGSAIDRPGRRPAFASLESLIPPLGTDLPTRSADRPQSMNHRRNEVQTDCAGFCASGNRIYPRFPRHPRDRFQGLKMRETPENIDWRSRRDSNPR